jgi:hypothetical protein
MINLSPIILCEKIPIDDRCRRITVTSSGALVGTNVPARLWYGLILFGVHNEDIADGISRSSYVRHQMSWMKE